MKGRKKVKSKRTRRGIGKFGYTEAGKLANTFRKIEEATSKENE